MVIYLLASIPRTSSMFLETEEAAGAADAPGAGVAAGFEGAGAAAGAVGFFG